MKKMKNTIIKPASVIRQEFSSMLMIWMRELQLIFKDIGVMEIIFAAPLLYPILYSVIYYPEVVNDMPIAVVDLSQSSISRQFSRNLNATPELSVAYNCISMEEAIRQFHNREIRGIIHIPESFSSDIAMNKQTNISIYSDMEFFLYYKTLMTGSSFVALETGKQIQINKLMMDGMTQKQAQVIAEPIALVDNVIANQGGGFASYGIPASLILIIQQTLILAIGIMAGTARERHTFGNLVPMDRKPIGTLPLVLGKSAAYFTIYAILCLYMLGMIPQWFGYGRAATLQELVALIIPFLLSSIFFGLTISILFKNRESPMLYFVFISIPLLFLSGIIWPLSNFGPVWLAVREIFPSSNAIFGFIKMKSLGASIFETRKEIISLWINTGFYFVTACITYGYQLNYTTHLPMELATHPFRDILKKSQIR